MGVLSRQLFEEPLFIKKDAAQTPSFAPYQQPVQPTGFEKAVTGTLEQAPRIGESIFNALDYLNPSR